MFDKELVKHILFLLDESLTAIENRNARIVSVNDFLCSNDGMILLDSICMKLIAIGESIKNLDKITMQNVKYSM